MPSRHIGIELPRYLGPEYDQAWDICAWNLGRKTTAGQIFILGWHGLGNRATTTEELWTHYEQLPRYGTAGHDGNHHSDQTLANLLFNTCSSIDCFAFACYGIGVGLAPGTFPATDAAQLRRVDRRSVERGFTKEWPGSTLALTFAALNASPAVEWLYLYRDVFTHRGTPSRHHFLGGENDGKTMIPANPKDLPAAWLVNAEVDAATIRPHVEAFRQIIARGIDSILGFAPLLP